MHSYLWSPSPSTGFFEPALSEAPRINGAEESVPIKARLVVVVFDMESPSNSSVRGAARSQGQQRKVVAVHMISQIEHPREAGSRGEILIPTSTGFLSVK